MDLSFSQKKKTLNIIMRKQPEIKKRTKDYFIQFKANKLEKFN